MQVKFILSLFFWTFLFTLPRPVLAGIYQTPTQYSELIIQKDIRPSGQSSWLPSYVSKNHTVLPDTIVEFQTTIKNAGNQTLTNIKVTDYLPLTLTYTSSRTEASYNSVNNTLTWTINELKPGEVQTTTIQTRAKTSGYLSKYRTLTTNRACAIASNNASDCDQTNFYIGQGQLDTKPQVNLPSTGASGFGVIAPGIASLAFLFLISTRVIR